MAFFEGGQGAARAEARDDGGEGAPMGGRSGNRGWGRHTWCGGPTPRSGVPPTAGAATAGRSLCRWHVATAGERVRDPVWSWRRWLGEALDQRYGFTFPSLRVLMGEPHAQ